MDTGRKARGLTDRLFIDECLSVALVAVAKERGVVAEYGPYIGKRGWSDRSIVQFALDQSFVVVTANRRDFLKAYARLPLHIGLVIIVPSTGRSEQVRLFAKALDVAIEHGDNLVNVLMEVLSTGDVHVLEWTSAHWDDRHIERPVW